MVAKYIYVFHVGKSPAIEEEATSNSQHALAASGSLALRLGQNSGQDVGDGAF